MKVKLSQAVKIFFSNSSLEMVYFEAIANALDANAVRKIFEIKGRKQDNPLIVHISDIDMLNNIAQKVRRSRKKID